MSGAAVVSVTDAEGEWNIYHPSGGTPLPALEGLRRALEKTFALPQFDAADFAAAYVAVNKQSPGDMWFINRGASWKTHCPAGVEWRYIVSVRHGDIHVVVCLVEPDTGHDTHKFITSRYKAGRLDAMIVWAAREEKDRK